jgi:hypothetical protein
MFRRFFFGIALAFAWTAPVAAYTVTGATLYSYADDRSEFYLNGIPLASCIPGPPCPENLMAYVFTPEAGDIGLIEEAQTVFNF